MKIIFVAIILLGSIKISYSQVTKTKVLTLDEAYKKVETDKIKYNYELKFNEDLKPFIKIKFTNDLTIKKTITTFEFKYYYSIGQSYINSTIIKKTIKPNSIGIMNLFLNDDDLKGYRQPSDLRLDKVEINTLRFIDGSIYKEYISMSKIN